VTKSTANSVLRPKARGNLRNKIFLWIFVLLAILIIFSGCAEPPKQQKRDWPTLEDVKDQATKIVVDPPKDTVGWIGAIAALAFTIALFAVSYWLFTRNQQKQEQNRQDNYDNLSKFLTYASQSNGTTPPKAEASNTTERKTS